MNQRKAIITFLRTPELGKVKTRLAADIGDEAALQVYMKLVDHTLDVCLEVDATRFLFYDREFPVRNARLNGFEYRLQEGSSLGQKMYNAFRDVFAERYDQVVIIGSDCATLASSHLNQAFIDLGQHDAVIGPATDGGYYLLGLKALNRLLFDGKQWSTDTVLEDTIKDFHSLGWSYTTGIPLSDIDTVADLQSVRPEWILNR